MKAGLPIPAIPDVAAADDAWQCRWRPSGEFALVHPSDWSIARYCVYDGWRYLLWEPVNTCRRAARRLLDGRLHDAMPLSV